MSETETRSEDRWQQTTLRVLLCLALSVLAHWGSQELLASLPPRPPPKPRPTRVAMTVTERKPPPESVAKVVVPEPVPEPVPQPLVELPMPEPMPEPPPEVVHDRLPDTPKPRTPRPPTPAATVETPPPNRAPTSNTPTAPVPLTGLTLESTSTTGNGPALPTGNTHAPNPNPTPVHGAPQQLPAAQTPVPTYEVTRMPTMRGDCLGKYTDAARAEGIEGTVMLDLVVTADGTTRDIKVVKGLGHGLDEAAIATLARCRFKPGTRGDTAVAVQLRAFKVRFFLDEGGR